MADRDVAAEEYLMKSTSRAVLASALAGLLLGSLLVVESGAASRSCRPFKPVPINNDEAPDKDEVLKTKVLKVTDKATESKPLTIEYRQGAGQGFPLHQGDPFFQDNTYFNLQIDSSRREVGLYVRTEWPTPSPSDIDMYLYTFGELVGWSEAWNNEVLDTVSANVWTGPGGTGYEMISGYPAFRCQGFTVENMSSSVPLGEDATFKVWLGKPGCPGATTWECGW